MTRIRNEFGRFVDEGKKSGTRDYYKNYYIEHIEQEKEKYKRYRFKNREKIRQQRNKYYGQKIPSRQKCNTCNCFLDKLGNCNNNHNRNTCEKCGSFLNKNNKCTRNHSLMIYQRIYKRNCDYCGKYYEGRGGQYCSSKCVSRVISPFVKGEKHPFWNNGSSFEPYGIEFNDELKFKIRARDNFTCQECKYDEKQLEYKLSIHHIDYNKQNNNSNNLISLCKNCHAQTNFDRVDWKNYFQEKVMKSAS